MNPDEDEFTELVDANFPRVDLVDKAANGTTFLIAKQADGSRGLLDAGFIRSLITKADAASPNESRETVTMTGSPAAIAQLIHGAAVRKATGAAPTTNEEKEAPVTHSGQPVAKADGELEDPGDLDLTQVLVDPDEGVLGDPADPGSPAWESVDAATARKWTAVAVRIKNALSVMADREMVEAVTADGDDAWDAMDLEDARCAMDYDVISTLASFAVGEQATADLATEALDAIGKALHLFDTAPLDAIEVLVPIAKAGRVLSSANEQALRNAAAAIQQVLAALPAPVDETGQPVAKSKGNAMTTTAGANPAAVTPTPQEFAAAVMQSLVDLTKAKGDAVVAVYNANGELAGTVDPADITPVADADTAADTSDTTDPAAADPGAATMAPADPAAVIPGTTTVASPAQPGDDPNQVAKAMQAALAPLLTEVLTPIAKQLADQAGLANVVAGLQEQVAKMAKMPDDRKSPLLNGGTGTAGIAGRDGDIGDPYADLRKAAAEATTPTAKTEAQAKLAYAEIKGRFARR